VTWPAYIFVQVMWWWTYLLSCLSGQSDFDSLHGWWCPELEEMLNLLSSDTGLLFVFVWYGLLRASATSGLRFQSFPRHSALVPEPVRAAAASRTVRLRSADAVLRSPDLHQRRHGGRWRQRDVRHRLVPQRLRVGR